MTVGSLLCWCQPSVAAVAAAADSEDNSVRSAAAIVKKEGMAGLYRGSNTSLFTAPLYMWGWLAALGVAGMQHHSTAI